MQECSAKRKMGREEREKGEGEDTYEVRVGKVEGDSLRSCVELLLCLDSVQIPIYSQSHYCTEKKKIMEECWLYLAQREKYQEGIK